MDEDKTVWLILAVLGLITLRLEIMNHRIGQLERVYTTESTARTVRVAPGPTAPPAAASAE
jgi:hypothetical protein